MTLPYTTQINDLLDTLGDDSSFDVNEKLQVFEQSEVLAVVVKRLLDVEAGGGGGGFIPSRSVGQASFVAIDFAVAGSTFSYVPWEFSQGDEDFIDLSTPTAPVPVAAGVYAYVFTVTQNGGGDGSPFYGVMTIDQDFYALTVQADALGLASSEYPQAVLPFEATWFSTAGSAFQTAIGNGGAAGSDTFTAQLYVQRVT